MSWVNDKENVIRDYLMIDEVLTRPMPLIKAPELDKYHGRAITLLEEALDSAFFNANVKGGISKYKSPDDCPPDYLTTLAIESGVYGWYLGDSEQQQRNTIKGARNIHKKAGTIDGLTAAIESLGLDVAVTTSGIPYSLTFLSPTTLTPEVTRAVTDRVNLYKSERDQVFFETQIPATATRYRATPSLIRASYYSKSKGTA